MALDTPHPLVVLNPEALAPLERGQDVKLLMDEERIVLARLDTQHMDLEKDVFGLDGSLRRTVPGYLTAHTRRLLLRQCARYPIAAARSLKACLERTPALAALHGFEVLYGTESLGQLRFEGVLAGAPGSDVEGEEPEPVVWDLGELP